MINFIKSHKFENGVLHFLGEWKDDDSETWLEESELCDCKNLLLAYAQSHSLTLSPTRKQQGCQVEQQIILSTNAKPQA